MENTIILGLTEGKGAGLVDNRQIRRRRMSLGAIEKRGNKAYTTKRTKIRKTKSGKLRRISKHGRA